MARITQSPYFFSIPPFGHSQSWFDHLEISDTPNEIFRFKSYRKFVFGRGFAFEAGAVGASLRMAIRLRYKKSGFSLRFAISNETGGGREITVEVMHNSWTQLSDNDEVGGRELGSTNNSSNKSSVARTRASTRVWQHQRELGSTMIASTRAQ